MILFALLRHLKGYSQQNVGCSRDGCLNGNSLRLAVVVERAIDPHHVSPYLPNRGLFVYWRRFATRLNRRPSAGGDLYTTEPLCLDASLFRLLWSCFRVDTPSPPHG